MVKQQNKDASEKAQVSPYPLLPPQDGCGLPRQQVDVYSFIMDTFTSDSQAVVL